MSVQAGIWNFDRKPVDPKLLAEFSEALKQQGPDGESSYVDTSIALLYRPFHTTAESRREKQPYVSRKGFILTWDGRLDNRESLIADLCSDLESEATDVEIVAAAFDRWQTDCFRQIVGDWALSVWRQEQRELILAIDYMAIRHIFYYLKQNRIWWSTDLAPLVLLSGEKFHIDDNYIAGYFTHEPDTDLTPYREIREVPPGEFVRIRSAGPIVERYWQFPKSQIHYKTDAEYEEHFRHVFRQAVRRRLRSDLPVLAELSGGLDSSSIVCMADHILAKEGAQTPRLDTLSFYDKSEPEGDDWLYFPKIEEMRGRAGYHIDASKRADCRAPFEHPGFSVLPGCIGTDRQIEIEAAEIVQRGGYRAVLSGLGGDEFLGGIPDPSAQLADLIVQFRFPSLARQLFSWSLVKRSPWIHLMWQALGELVPSSLGRYFPQFARTEPWVDKTFEKTHSEAILVMKGGKDDGFTLPTRRSFMRGIRTMTKRMAKCSMSDVLQETRYPYLDQTLIEFAGSIPSTQLLRPGQRRSLMRRSLIDVVPSTILSRRTKQLGSRTPILSLDAQRDNLTRVFQTSLSSQMGYIHADVFLQQLRGIRAGGGIHILPALKTISLELWLCEFAPRLYVDALSFTAASSSNPAKECGHYETSPASSASGMLDYPRRKEDNCDEVHQA